MHNTSGHVPFFVKTLNKEEEGNDILLSQEIACNLICWIVDTNVSEIASTCVLPTVL